jgi:hypothetical protein
MKHKKNEKKAIQGNTHIFPRDEKKARIEATIYGMTKALADFPALKTKDAEIYARIAYERVHRFSNDYPFYKRIFIECYATGYHKNGERYKADSKAYKNELSTLSALGEVGFYAVLYPMVAEQQKVKV